MSLGQNGMPNDLPPGDKVDPAGFAWAKLGQIAPEVGYFLSPDLMVSVQLRLQIVTGATPFYAVPTDTTTCGTSMICAAPSLAIAGFARAHYPVSLRRPASRSSRRWWAEERSGTSRRSTRIPRCGSDMHTTCVDTIAAGPIFLGVGGGLFYNLSDAFALTAETNLIAGFTNFTFNIDVNVGIAVEY